MGKIVLGKAGGKNAWLDIDVLIRTRALIQANSGGGKSFLIRRMAEQLFGKVQVIILDRDGEFASLREKFGFVLVGPGGETPTHTGSAELVARRLLETKASAVIDLYELKPDERHRWVRLFLTALMNAPKSLWHPVVIFVDEAHDFCPEKGEGESEAKKAVLDLCSRGRKRGFCAILATQRLAKLDKSASAEMLNVLIGPTFQDIDLARAHKALGIPRKDQPAFDEEMKVVDAGRFYALGRAISKRRILIQIGEIATTHPEPGSAKHAAAPPPTPAQVKHLLPKLADLPKEAEEKVRTEAQFRKEIRHLTMENKRLAREGKKGAPAVAPLRPVAIDRKALTAEIQKAVAARDEQWMKHAEALANSYNKALDGFYVAMDQAIAQGKRRAQVKRPTPPKASPIRLPATLGKPTAPPPRPLLTVRASTPRPAVPHPAAAGTGANGEWEDLVPYQRGLLSAIADFEAIGRMVVAKTWVAARAGKSSKSGTFGNMMGNLRSRGYIDYKMTEQGKPGIALTEEGRRITPAVDAPLDSEQMLASCMEILSPYQRALLKVAHEAYPEAITKEELAERAGKSAGSGTFGNMVGSLRSAGMIDYPEKGSVRCEDWLFIE